MKAKALGKKAWKWLVSIVMLLVSVAVGGLFTSGTTASYTFLKMIPASWHPIIGWAVIIGAVGAFLIQLYHAVKKAL